MFWVSSEFHKVVVSRLSEWHCSLSTMVFGVVLLLPVSMYDTGGAVWNGFKTWISEPNLGMSMFLLGIARVTILGVNGFWRPTYYLRAVGSAVSMAVWLTVSLGFLSGGYIGTWAAVYPVFVIVSAVNVFQALEDAKHMEISRRANRAFSEARHVPSPG